MRKAADAFRTISEVAEELDVQKHVLRFWEIKFPQIKPLKRGGGRRYYRPADVELLRGIRAFLHSDGYTIKGVQKILRDQGVDAVKERGQSMPTEPASKAPPRKLGARTRSAPVKAAGGALPPETVTVLKKLVRELQSCRAKLAAPAPAAEQPAATASRRSAR